MRLASPRSASLATPAPLMRILSGLISRWTMLRECGVLQGAGDVANNVNSVADLQATKPFQQRLGTGAVNIFKDEVVFAGGGHPAPRQNRGRCWDG